MKARSARQKKIKKAGIIQLTAGIAILAVLLATLLAWPDLFRMPIQRSTAIRIDEIMPVNISFLPDEQGEYHPWFELYNASEKAVDLRGYSVSDTANDPQKWVFPQIILEAGTHLVVFASGLDISDPEQKYLHTNFRLDAEQTRLYLMNNRGHIIDSLEKSGIPDNISYGRKIDDPENWLFFPQPTPGEPNLTLGYTSIDEISDVAANNVIITEVMASNSHTLADEDGDFPDWLEIRNNMDIPVDLTGYMLSDNREDPARWVFPQVILQPGEYLVVFASGKDRRDPAANLHTNFRINKQEDEIILTSAGGYICDIVNIDNLPTDVSYGRDPLFPDRWLYFVAATPGAENSTYGFSSLDFTQEVLDSPVHITELLASNSYILADEDGAYPDWIEIHNHSSNPVDLGGYSLSDDKDEPFKWLFPEIIIQPDEYLLIFASSKDRRESAGNLHTNFNINRSRDQIWFRDREGRVIDHIEIEDHRPNVSYGRDPEAPENWYFYPSPTPGGKNVTYGFERLGDEADSAYSRLRLTEIMSMNTSGLRDDDNDYPNWIEIQNTGQDTVSLQGVGLSDSRDDPLRWTFPITDIAPGERLVVFASGKDRVNLEREIFHTNFGVSVLGEPIILADPLGRTIDEVKVPRMPENTSYGRPEFEQEEDIWLYFSDPSPGRENNGRAWVGMTRPPLFSQPGGFYENYVTIEMHNPQEIGEIRYTLDGSLPDRNSLLYSGPMTIAKTSMLRANVFADNMLAGNDTVQTYFIDEHHTLPVVSIAIDPDDFSHPLYGIHSRGPNASDEFPYWGANYHQDWERPAHFEFYEDDGRLGYRLHVGFKIFGAFSRAMDQKSFAIYARNLYEYDEMTYPFLENKDLVNFKHLVLRTSGQDATLSKIRDIMMTSLLQESTNLDMQGYRQSVLYINGRYWGIYNIREKINRYFTYYNHDLEDLDAVDILQGNATSSRFFKAGDNKHYMEMLDFISSNDMNRQENYEYIKSILDVENYADYQIAQMYYAHTDNGNIRFWREHGPEGKWRWIIYDLDWGFFNVEHNTVWFIINPAGTGHAQSFSTRLIRGLLENDEFKQMFVERFAWHMNNTFQPERVISFIDQLAANIEPEMHRSVQRWSRPSSIAAWETQVERLRDFARRRPGIILTYIQRHFQLSDEEMTIFDAWHER